jgi:hypothetical protein
MATGYDPQALELALTDEEREALLAEEQDQGEEGSETPPDEGGEPAEPEKGSEEKSEDASPEPSDAPESTIDSGEGEEAEGEKKGDSEADVDESEKVILSEDKKHIIPYSELVKAREQAKVLEDQLKQLQAELETLKAAQQTGQVPPGQQPPIQQQQFPIEYDEDGNPVMRIPIPQADDATLRRWLKEARDEGDVDLEAEIQREISRRAAKEAVTAVEFEQAMAEFRAQNPWYQEDASGAPLNEESLRFQTTMAHLAQLRASGHPQYASMTPRQAFQKALELIGKAPQAKPENPEPKPESKAEEKSGQPDLDELLKKAREEGFKEALRKFNIKPADAEATPSGLSGVPSAGDVPSDSKWEQEAQRLDQLAEKNYPKFEEELTRLYRKNPRFVKWYEERGG